MSVEQIEDAFGVTVNVTCPVDGCVEKDGIRKGLPTITSFHFEKKSKPKGDSAVYNYDYPVQIKPYECKNCGNWEME